MTKLDDEMQPQIELRDKPHNLFPALQLRPVLDKKDPLSEYLRRLPKSTGN
jgi:hypothetical protein